MRPVAHPLGSHVRAAGIAASQTVGLPFRRIEGTVVEWDEYAAIHGLHKETNVCESTLGHH